MILERANEGECARDVVVGDDQRTVEPVVNIIFDRPKLLDDPGVGPVLERPAEIDADQFAENRRIGAFRIVRGQGSHGAAAYMISRSSRSGKGTNRALGGV